MTHWPDGYERHILDSVDSTLTEAARLLPGVSGPTWILAAEQTAARGRRGRTWATPRGNFAATLILPRQEPLDIAALRSFVASLALWRSFVAVTGREDHFTLKWPNDVLLRDGKVAGILLESLGDHLVIGIGVNLATAPVADAVELRATLPVSLRGCLGIEMTPGDFLDVLAAEYAALETDFRTFGFAPIRAAWLAHAARRGEIITARTMRDETVGVFKDVDASGSLILNTATGDVAITAADVYF